MGGPPRERSPRIVVVGSTIVDLTTFTDDFPGPGQTILARRFDFGWGGKGANQAVAAALCGATVDMVARVGDDLFGPATIQNFVAKGIGAEHVRVAAGAASGAAAILVDSDGQNRIIVVTGANDRLVPTDVDAAIDTIRRADVVVLQLEVPLDTVYHVIAIAAEHRVPCILNPAPAQPIDLRAVATTSYVIPNEFEAEALTGSPARTPAEAEICGRRLLAQGVARAIITLGDRGAVLVSPEGAVHVPAFAVPVKDSTGAGDAFVGSFAVFVAEGHTERDAIARANLYAALSTMEVGTQKAFVSRERFDVEWQARRQASYLGGSVV
jgi:ribokinase